MARAKLTKAEKQKRAKARKREKMTREYNRMFQQAQQVFHQRDVGRFVTFEELLNEAGVNYRAKTVTEKNLKALKKIQTAKQILQKAYTRTLRRRTSTKTRKTLQQITVELDESKYLDTFKSKSDRIIRACYEDFMRFRDIVPYPKEAEFQALTDFLINALNRSQEEKYDISQSIEYFYRVNGSLEPEELYDEITNAHAIIVTDFEHMIRTKIESYQFF